MIKLVVFYENFKNFELRLSMNSEIPRWKLKPKQK